MTKFKAIKETTVIVRGPEETDNPGVWDIEFAGEGQRFEFDGMTGEMGLWDITEYDDQQQETRTGTAVGIDIYEALKYYFGFDEMEEHK